jgi:hypothetical protein
VFDSGALVIESYLIEVLASDSTFKEVAECDGKDPIIIVNRESFVHIASLTT